jgi:hypothetical protein
MRCQYYISFNAGANWTEFFPSNSPKLKLSKYPNEIFKRWDVDKFKIVRTKNQSVYDILSGMFFDKTDFGTDIKYKISVLGVDKFYFIAPITSGNMDSQNSVYEVNPEPDDLYRPILQKYEFKYQDRSAGDAIWNISNDYWITTTLQALLFNNDTFTTLSDIAKSVTWDNSTGGAARAEAITDPSYTTSYAVIKVLTFSGDIITLNSCVVGGGVIDTVNISGVGEYILIATKAQQFELYNKSAAPKSGAFTNLIYIYKHTDNIGIGGSLYDCLDQVINDSGYMNLAYSIKSTILWNDVLGSDPPPNIDTYITANPNNDYVRQASAIFNDVWLSRVCSLTVDKVYVQETSLKDVMEFLKLKYRMWWFIDEDGNFRIEHEKYFKDYDSQATISTYILDKPEIDQKNCTYEYKGLNIQINYSESNEKNEDWKAFPIVYSQKMNFATSDVNISNLSTDLGNIKDNPGDVSNSGLMLVRMKRKGSEYLVSIDQSEVSANFYLNTYMGWFYTLKYYHDYNADAGTGYINNIAHTFSGVKEFLKQQKVRFRHTSDVKWYKPFTLSLGNGWIDELELDPETGMHSINFGFDPYK